MRESDERITVGCCWDGRDYYPREYVEILYRSVRRNTTVPFDFVLYAGPEAMAGGRTSGLDRGIRVVPSGLPYWWGAMRFWEPSPPGVETEAILYLDLDQIIVGSLDDLIRFPSDFVCMKDWPAHRCPRGLERNVNVSTTLLRRGAGARVWEEYTRRGCPAWDPLARIDRGDIPEAAQSIINDPRNGIAVDLFPESWVASYRLSVLDRGMPSDCRVVSFHGRPKPHEVVSSTPWAKECWR